MTPWVLPTPGLTGLSSLLSYSCAILPLTISGWAGRRSRGGCSVDFFARHHRPGNARCLIREGDSRDLRWFALEELRHPWLARGILARHAHHRGRTNDKQSAEVTVALLGDPAEPFLSTRAVWPRCESEPPRELTPCINTACCSTVFTATNRIVGRVTASHIASASAASVLPRFTSGFT